MGRISVFLLEKYALGEVTPFEWLRFRLVSARDPEAAKKIAELRKENRAWRRGMAVPAYCLPQGGKKRGRQMLSHRNRSPLFFSGCAAAAAVFAVGAVLAPEPPAVVRLKGSSPSASPELRVFLQDGTALSDGEFIKAGETVQLAYRVPESEWGIIFSVDGRGAVTDHLSGEGGANSASLLVPGKQIPLGEAYRLDDAPRYEAFFLVVSKEAPDVPGILKAASKSALEPENLSALLQRNFPKVQVVSILLRKELP